MPRDGTGNYTLPVGTPVVSGTVVSSIDFNTFAGDVGGEIQSSVDRSGRGAALADLPMGGHRHSNVALSNGRNTYTSAADVQDGNVIWCGNAVGTANAVTLTPNPAILAYKDGQAFEARLVNAPNSGAVTVAVSGLAALPLTKNGGVALAANDLPANAVVRVIVNNGATQMEVNKIKTGTMATQDANNVAITGGAMSGVAITGGSISSTTIDGTPIGSTVRSSGKFTTLDANSTVTLSPASANVTISPTGTGTVTINPATLGSIDNMAIGNTTRSFVKATTGDFTSTLVVSGHTTFEGVTSTGATGTGKLVFDTSPTINGPVLTGLVTNSSSTHAFTNGVRTTGAFANNLANAVGFDLSAGTGRLFFWDGAASATVVAQWTATTFASNVATTTGALTVNGSISTVSGAVSASGGRYFMQDSGSDVLIGNQSAGKVLIYRSGAQIVSFDAGGATTIGTPGSPYAAAFLTVHTGANDNLFISDNGPGVRILSGSDALGAYKPLDIQASAITINNASGGTIAFGGMTFTNAGNLTKGVTVTAGSISTGNYTVDFTNGPYQFITNGAAFTITASTADGGCQLLVTNNATAGAITFSGFTVSGNTGEALTTTNGNKFLIAIIRVNGVSSYTIKALQ